MNKQKFVDLLRNPEQISTSELSELETIAKENPYFQSGHIVIARASRLLKTALSAKKINTAAIYATNRNTLKSYMQGNSIAKPPRTKEKQTPVRETVRDSPKSKDSQVLIPRKAPQLLNKTDHDKLIDNIYANLDNWKKSRDQFLEFEKVSDELELPIKKEEIDNAVEKIKSQIAEEIIAEDKILSDQLDKKEVTQETEEIATSIIDDVADNEIDSSPKSKLEIEDPVIEKNDDSKEEIKKEEIKKEEIKKEEIKKEDEVKESTTKDEIAAEESFNATDYLKSLRKEKKQEDLKKDDLVENIEAAANEDTKAENSEEEAIIPKPEELEISTPPVESLDIVDNDITSKLIDDEIEQVIKGLENNTEVQEISEEIKEPVNEKNDIPDASDQEVNREESKLDEKVPSLDEQKNKVIPLSKSGKTNKKFRLSVLNRRKGKIPLSKKKSLSKSDEKSTDSKSDISSLDKTDEVEKKVETKSSEKKKNRLKAANDITANDVVANQSVLIDSFLKSKPTIKVNKDIPESEIVDLSEASSEFPKEAITENLAKILVSQNKIDAAIKVYHKLIVQYPDKKSLYQSKINDLELEPPSSNKSENEADLLLKFTEENSSIFVSSWDELSELAIELSKDISSLPKEQVTESLAKVLTHHKLFEQSILIYERLNLIYPEKIAYFASQIEKLKIK